MFIGILLNVLVSFSVGIVSFLVYRSSRIVEIDYEILPLRSFGLFWFFMSAVWVLIASMDFLSYLTGETALPEAFVFAPIIMAYAFQVFVGLSVVMIARFIYITAIGQKGLTSFMYGYWALYGIFLLALFTYGVQPWTRNFFARQITSPNEALIVFVAMFTPLWLLGIKLFFETFYRRTGIQKQVANFLLFSSASLLLVGVAGLLDEAGLVYGWAVTAARLGSLVAAVLSYIGVFALHNPKELVV
ncbi:MAG: hypothetical protein AAB372_01235 [Patescibacteria group bacterium]